MSDYVPGAHILWNEFSCHHCGALPPDFRKEGEITYQYRLLFEIFEAARELYWKQFPGSGLPISSFYRCTDHQMKLYLTKKSSTPYSVHVFGLAIDVQPREKKRGCLALVKILKKLPFDLRIGWKDYLEKPWPWVHFDIGYIIEPRYSGMLRKGAEW